MSTVVTRASEPPKQSRIDWREKALLAAIAVLFLAVAIRSALLRPFWFDELSTFFISSIPTLKEMFEAIHADGNPLMYFFAGADHLGFATSYGIGTSPSLDSGLFGCGIHGLFLCPA